MKKERRVPIFFACDENFVKYTVVALESMIANASTERKYIIHVLNTDISENMKQVLYHMANDNFEIQFNNVTNYLRTIHEKLPIRDYYSHTTYYRFFIAEMFPEYEKAIYIDSDTIVKGDISRLYDFDLGDNYVGGVNDQVVVQDPIFGDYVEKVLGVERNNYFNAGLLLINCDQFRKNNVLDQFCKLLHMYNFVVAQDQDYLNVICHNKVLWLPQVWNTEVFGEIAPKEEDICILHYNLAAKPWHYKDCRMQQYFWKYAERSGVYPEILKELETYTDEQRAEDMASGANLLELAKQEIAKENNYRPNLLARSLNHGRTMSLGVVTINIENMYFVQSLNTINKEADKRGYFTNIVVCDESLEWERKLIQGLAERQMEGILINPINKGKEFEEFLLSLHIPIVCIGNQVSGKITTVQVNEMAAAMDAVELIVSKGYKKIVFICPPLEMEETQNIYVHKQREKGFKAAMAIHPELKMKMIGKTEFLPEVERICARGLHEKTAFLCSGDSYALSIMQWGTKKGLMIPKDFGLMGFDDISLLQYITPKLTTVSTNLEGVASTAVVELIQQIDSKEYSPKSIYLNYHILDRDTL